jgi:hypothetical protein
MAHAAGMGVPADATLFPSVTAETCISQMPQDLEFNRL